MAWDAWQGSDMVLHDISIAETMFRTLPLDISLWVEHRSGFISFPGVVQAELSSNIWYVMDRSVVDRNVWFCLH